MVLTVPLASEMRMPKTLIPLPVALIVPLLWMPPPIVLLFVTASATVALLKPAPAFPGEIVPAFVTAPVTVELLITIEVTVVFAGFVTDACV
jgi:hypothetical protein